MAIKTTMDDKWKMLTIIFQITFLIMLLVSLYLVIISIWNQQYIALIISLFLVLFCFLQENEFKNAKKTKDITHINIIVRCMMGMLGKLY